MKKNFKLYERVAIHRVGSKILDGSVGCILGKSTSGIIDVYIVLLDMPVLQDDFGSTKAVCVIESCLDRIH